MSHQQKQILLTVEVVTVDDPEWQAIDPSTRVQLRVSDGSGHVRTWIMTINGTTNVVTTAIEELKTQLSERLDAWLGIPF